MLGKLAKWLISISIAILITFSIGVIGVGVYNSGKIKAEEKTQQELLDAKRIAASLKRALSQASNSESDPQPNQSPSASQAQASSVQPSVTTSKATPGTGQGYALIRNQTKEMSKTSAKKPVKNDYQERRDTYASMQETCNNWTKWYNQDRTNTSAIHMNVSCRDAAEYARTHLNTNTGAPNYVALNSINKPSSSGNATLIGVNDDSESPVCESLRREQDSIEAQLKKGYNVHRGERLRDRRRAVRDQMREANCY